MNIRYRKADAKELNSCLDPILQQILGHLEHIIKALKTNALHCYTIMGFELLKSIKVCIYVSTYLSM